MFSSIYSALSGMIGFSKGLDVISNNVANMNTPGFKASELQFRDLFYRYGLSQGGGQGSEQVGEGVDTGSTRMRFTQGDLRETTNPLDLAIDGNGFFILRKDGQTFYTRGGQFEFNDQGILVEHDSQAHVAGFNGGALADISILGLRVRSPQATSEVKFTDVLNVNSASFDVTGVTIFDAAGASHTFTVRLTKDNDVALNSALLSTTDTVSTLNRTNSSSIKTTRDVTTTNAVALTATLQTLKTATPVQPTYTVIAGDTWAQIATHQYGDAAAVTELTAQLGGDPAVDPTAGEVLNLPASLTFTVPPYYTVPAGDITWAALATSLYGNASAVSALQTALGTTTLPAPGASLTNLPATLNVATTTTQTVSPYYVVASGDTWATIANALYGSNAAGGDLANALGLDPAVQPQTNDELNNLPSTLSLASPVTATVPAYYAVQAGDTWDSIARALYGSAVGSGLQTALGAPALTAGTHLTNLPATLTVTNGSGTVNRWTVEVLEGTTSIGTGEIRYDGAGAAITGFQTVNVNYTPTGVPSSAITLDFTGSQSFSGPQSTIKVSSQNGVGPGSLIESSFDEKGVLTLKYSSSQTETRDTLALAWFEDLQALTLSGGNRFTSRAGQAPILAAPSGKGMGKISSKHIELSNVDLTAQFTDIVVIQRGYQASSQVISVANEMAQQLLDLRSRK